MSSCAVSPETVCHNPLATVPDSSVPAELRTFDLSDKAFETEGVRKNNDRIFILPFYGREIYYLLKILDRLAENSNRCVDIRPAVLGAELIRDRARERGF